jgi:Zn-dependent peptidase ImmA (M78 family)
MHKELYKSMKIESTEEWKYLINCMDPREYGFFEYHAYTFAGLVLVPTKELKKRFYRAIELYKSEGFDPRELSSSSIAIDYISTYLAKEFEVSPEVVKKRIQKEGLMG